MSRRKAPTLATLADNAAAGRRVVLSAGTLDGAFLAALAKVHFSLRKENLVPIGTIDGDQVSTWADGVTTANAQSDIEQDGKKHAKEHAK